MAKTYYNAGPCGPDHSELQLRILTESNELEIQLLSGFEERDIILDREQIEELIADLRQALTRFTESPKPVKTSGSI